MASGFILPVSDFFVERQVPVHNSLLASLRSYLVEEK